MARGHPDFFGQSTFYKFGDILNSQDTVNCPAGETTEVINENYKGKTYGGFVFWQAALVTSESSLIVTMDDVQINYIWPYQHEFYCFDDFVNFPFSLLGIKYVASDTYYVTMRMNKDYTFDYQFKVEFINGDIVQRTVGYDLNFAVIQ